MQIKPLSEVRFGFIGAGAIAHYAADAVLRHPNAKLVAVQDLHVERLKTLQKKHSLEFAHEKVEDLLANKAVDAVYIAVPNKFHIPLTIQALEAGKHVILEKPFAMNAAEAEKAIALSEKLGLVLTVGMNQRFSADSQKIKQLVEQGVLGEIYHAKAYWRRRAGIPKLGTWFVSQEVAGGGSLYDIGVHMLDLCLWTINNYKPVSVVGATYTKFGNRGLGEGGWGFPIAATPLSTSTISPPRSSVSPMARLSRSTLHGPAISRRATATTSRSTARKRAHRCVRRGFSATGAGLPAMYEVVEELVLP